MIRLSWCLRYHQFVIKVVTRPCWTISNKHHDNALIFHVIVFFFLSMIVCFSFDLFKILWIFDHPQISVKWFQSFRYPKLPDQVAMWHAHYPYQTSHENWYHGFCNHHHSLCFSFFFFFLVFEVNKYIKFQMQQRIWCNNI